VSIKPGDRITLKVPLIDGWKGSGTVTWAGDGIVMFRRDGATGALADRSVACRHEVRRHRR
jgi:hypothetical protein